MSLFDYVTGSSNYGDSSSTALSPPSLSVTSGNLLVYIGKWEEGGASDAATVTIGDGGLSLSWSTPVYANIAAADPDSRCVIAWAKVGTGGTATVTGTLSVARQFREFHLHQFEMGSGYTPTEIATTTGNSSTAVATWATSSITGVVDDLVAVGVVTGNGNFTINGTSPLSLQANAQGRSKLIAGKIASGGSMSPGGAIIDASHAYAAAGFQLRVSGGGGGSTQPPRSMQQFRLRRAG